MLRAPSRREAAWNNSVRADSRSLQKTDAQSIFKPERAPAWLSTPGVIFSHGLLGKLCGASAEPASGSGCKWGSVLIAVVSDCLE